MNTKKNLIIDEAGNELEPPDPTSDVGRLIYLLEYARKRKFELGPIIQVGDVIVHVADPSVRAAPGPQTRTEVDIWKAHGHDGDE